MKIGMLLIGLIVSLSACTADPVKSNAAAIKKAEAKGFPILIYSRRENDQLDFINVSTQPIKEIDLRLGICINWSGGQYNVIERRQLKKGLRVTIKGDFQPGYAFKVRRARVDVIDKSVKNIYAYNFWNEVGTRILATRIVFADGTPPGIYAKKAVKALLTSRVKNSCSSASDNIPPDMQFIHS